MDDNDNMYIIYCVLMSSKTIKCLSYDYNHGGFYWANEMQKSYIFGDIEEAKIKYNEVQNKLPFENEDCVIIYIKKIQMENIDNKVIFKNKI